MMLISYCIWDFLFDFILKIQMDGSSSGSNKRKQLSWAEPILRFARGNVLPLGTSLSLCAFKFYF